jgi:L-seryl-tRNA(Ser) seleniumtransferase
MKRADSWASLVPPVDGLLRRPLLETASLEHGRALVLAAVRDAVASVRDSLRADSGTRPEHRDEVAALIERAALAQLDRRSLSSLRRVFNLTGTVLHTNLGRAPLAAEVIAAITDAASACNLEYDLEAGGRGERDDHVADWFKRTSGAEAALVVNNNAAAVLLALNSLANRREVIVSRGELIEIGGAFRMPDVMARAGCRLVEVGTTNRTHLADYAAAIGPRTGALMKVHPSNYAITGFTKSVDEAEIAELARARGVPFIVDLGSGSLIDLTQYGLPPEPTAKQVIEQGADIVTFSGDKLLGGPQAGLVVGRGELVAKLRRNPLKRALRVDKLTLAALAATLRLYDDPDRLAQRLPALRLLVRGAADIRGVADRLSGPVGDALGGAAGLAVESCSSQVGSGSLPVDRLTSWALTIRPTGGKRGAGKRVEQLAASFRALPVPVIGRIEDGALKFDLRCLEDEAAFLAQLPGLSIGSDS